MKLYEGDLKVNYWWLSINPRMIRFRDFDVDDTFFYYFNIEDVNEKKLLNKFLEVKKNEKVIIYERMSGTDGKIIGLCEIEEEYNDNKICFKKTENLTNSISKNLILSLRDIGNIEPLRFENENFFKLSEKEFNIIYKIIDEMNPKFSYMNEEDYLKEDFLNDVIFDADEFDNLKDLILTRKNVILEGIPGVGKTFIAKRIAYAIIGKKATGRILNIEFHKNYSCDEFIEGYRPDDIGIYKYREGCFKHFCNKARNNRDKKYFLIIDEINRGDIIKIFGETFMLLEADKRGKENYVELSASKERFYIPNNLFIIGTMNYLADSAIISDFAVRRRFCFYKVKDVFDNKKFKNLIEKSELKKNLVKLIIEINSALDDNKKIGHYYVLKDKNDFETKKTIKYELIPFVEELFKNDISLKNEFTIKLLNLIN